jgi:uncharacterized protein (DUF433 family)
MPLDWSKCPAVERLPGMAGGAWLFRGTRRPESTVFENLNDGPVDDIVEMFDGLSREQVNAILAFTAHSLATSPLAR